MLESLDVIPASLFYYRDRIYTDCLFQCLVSIVSFDIGSGLVVVKFIVYEIDVNVRMLFRYPGKGFRQACGTEIIIERICVCGHNTQHSHK